LKRTLLVLTYSLIFYKIFSGEKKQQESDESSGTRSARFSVQKIVTIQK